MRARFEKLYRKQVFLHHFKEYMEGAAFEESLDAMNEIIDDYKLLQIAKPPEKIPRFIPWN